MPLIKSGAPGATGFMDGSGTILLGQHAGTSMLEWALRYAQHGYYVFQIAEGSKYPKRNCPACDRKDDRYQEEHHQGGVCTAHPNGLAICHGHLAATRDPEVITAWWTSRPHCNIGINMGRSGTAVVDVDTALKADGTHKVGDQTMARLAETYGLMPAGPMVRTRSGGWQYYLTHPNGMVLKSSAGRDDHLVGVGQDVDIKATSAYTVAPPSIITDDQRLVTGQYTWVNDPWQPRPDVPAWIPQEIEKRQEAKRPQRPTSWTPGQYSTSDATADEVRQHVIGLADEVVRTSEGARNDTLFRQCAKAHDYAAAGQIDPNEVDDIFISAGLAAGLEHSGVIGTVASARNRPNRRPYTWQSRTSRNSTTSNEGQAVASVIPEQRTENEPATSRGPLHGIEMLNVDTVYSRKGDQMGAAELYVEDVDGGYPLRWNGHSERFYHYAEGCWREDDKRNTRLGGLVDSLGRKVTNLVDADIARMRKQMAEGEGDAELLKELIKVRPNWYKTYRSAGGRAGIMSFVATSVEPVDTEQMDAAPHLLNFTNGTYDVRTGELREADPNDYLTHRVEHALDATLAEKPLEEAAPLFYGLLMRACAAQGEVDEETARQRAEAVVRALGSMISGECGDKAMLVFEGGTNIGKTVILEIIQTILGQQLATSSKPNLLIKTRGDKHDATEYALKGRRFVLVNELTTQMTLDEGQVLRLINPGGSTLTVRRLGQQEENINITWTIAITTNELPRARVTAQVLGRTVIYPMSQIPVPREEQDSSLRRRILTEEGGAVLAHLVRWWREWYTASQNGGSGLIITEEMTRALAEFKDDNASSASMFRDERTVAGGYSKANVLWNHFNLWLDTQRPEVRREYEMGRTTFFKEVESWEGVTPHLEHKAGRNPVRKGFHGVTVTMEDGTPLMGA